MLPRNVRKRFAQARPRMLCIAQFLTTNWAGSWSRDRWSAAAGSVERCRWIWSPGREQGWHKLESTGPSLVVCGTETWGGKKTMRRLVHETPVFKCIWWRWLVLLSLSWLLARTPSPLVTQAIAAFRFALTRTTLVRVLMASGLWAEEGPLLACSSTIKSPTAVTSWIICSSQTSEPPCKCWRLEMVVGDSEDLLPVTCVMSVDMHTLQSCDEHLLYCTAGIIIFWWKAKNRL